MAGTLNVSATLANDAGFRLRVQAALATAALNVAAEVQTGEDAIVYQKRHALAIAVLSNMGAYLDRFCWAAAVNATIAGEAGSPVSVSSSTAANPSVITTAAAHGYTTGDQVEISGQTVNTAINGTWTATVLTSTTFSVPVLGNAAGTTGGVVVKQPPDADVQFAVNSAWSDFAGVGVTD